VEKGLSSLNEFANVFTIKGKKRYNPESFLRAVRQTVTDLLNKNREIKVKLILSCYMEMTSASKGMFIEPSSFYSGVEINLDSTNV